MSPKRSKKPEEAAAKAPRAPEGVAGRQTVRAAQEGGWMAADEFREAAAKAAAGGDVVVDLEGLDHLDASSLQILLALDAEQKRGARRLWLANASPAALRWFEYAGAAERFAFA